MFLQDAVHCGGSDELARLLAGAGVEDGRVPVVLGHGPAELVAGAIRAAEPGKLSSFTEKSDQKRSALCSLICRAF